MHMVILSISTCLSSLILNSHSHRVTYWSDAAPGARPCDRRARTDATSHGASQGTGCHGWWATAPRDSAPMHAWPIRRLDAGTVLLAPSRGQTPTHRSLLEQRHTWCKHKTVAEKTLHLLSGFGTEAKIGYSSKIYTLCPSNPSNRESIMPLSQRSWMVTIHFIVLLIGDHNYVHTR